MADSTADVRVARAEGVMRALKRSGEDLLGRAVALAPKDTGELRASATLAFEVNGERHEGEGAYVAAFAAARRHARAGTLRSVDVEVAFTTVYAAYQHDHDELHHDEGEARYLEKPLGQMVGNYRKALELEDELALRRA